MHPIQAKLAAIRRRSVWVLAGYGLARWLAIGAGAVTVLAMLDYLLRYQDPGLRWISSFLAIATLAWAGWRYVWPALARRLGDVDLALRVERRFPELADSLASTVQFLEQPDDLPHAGSAELRRAVIVQTTTAVENLRPADVVDAKPAWRAIGLAGATLLVAAGMYLADAASARLALARLALPFTAQEWPKSNHLELVKPVRRIALGQRFEVEVTDARGADLPDDVYIHYRFAADSGGYVESVDAMQMARGVMVAGKDNVTRPFSYRVTGGDDDSMPWVDLEVVEPPAVTELALELISPEYSGWPRRGSDPHVRGLVGSQILLAGRTTKPLRAARVQIENGVAIDLSVSPDGYQFELAGDAPAQFVIEKSGAYWFELEDEEGFAGGQNVRYEIRVIEDRAPTVTLEQPRSDLSVTPQATVPISVLAKDDLALRSIELRYTRSDRSSEPETVVPLLVGPERVTLPDDFNPAAGLDAGQSLLVEHNLELSAMELKPGTQLSLYATANDYVPQAGQSLARRLYIISHHELEDRLAEKQSFILSELDRVLKLEQESRNQLSGLQIQLDQVGQLTKQDVDHLQAAELTQRQVERGLTSPTEGVKGHIENLLADMENNRVEGDDIRRRMEGFLKEIARLERDHLPAISREMTAAMKGAQADLQGRRGGSETPGQTPAGEQPAGQPPSAASPEGEKPADAGQPGEKPAKPEPPRSGAADAPENQPAAPASPADSLGLAAEHQDQVIGSLEQMLGDLAQWDNYRRFHRELGQMRRDQDALRDETTNLGRETLTRDVRDLSQQQQADLNKLAQRQNELARRFDKTLQEMRDMLEQLEQSDPLAADALADALHEANQKAISMAMNEAGRNVERNQVGQAAERQAGVSEQLQELLDILSNRREFELNRLVRKLREAEQKTAQLREQQKGLQQKFAEAEKIEDEQQRRRELERLSREQRQLQEETERFARQLRRLQAENASRAANRSSGRMGQAGESGEAGQGGQAAEQAEAAQRDLDEAQQQLAQQRRQAEIDLAMEQLARMEDSIRGMITRQRQLLTETEQYEGLRAKQDGRLSRSQSISVRDLSRQQTGLREETRGLSKRLSAAAAFELALDSAARYMEQAARRLDELDTGVDTARAQRNAATRFEQLLAALADDNDQQKQDGDSPSGQAGEQGEQGQGEQQEGELHQLAELKLLKLLQQDINLRTLELEDASRRQGLTAAEQEEFQLLAEEQGQLADLLLDLSQPANTKLDDLEKPPALELDPPSDDADPLEKLLEQLP